MATSPRFRTAVPADAEPIRLLVRRAYARWVDIIGREPLPMTADYDDTLRLHRFDLLVDASDKIVGVLETMEREHDLWFENVAVEPSEQGKGYGRLLLERAFAVARDMDRPILRLATNAAFEANIAWYERHGFRVEARHPFRGGTAVAMARAMDAG